MTLNPENYCIPCRKMLFGQTTKQPFTVVMAGNYTF